MVFIKDKEDKGERSFSVGVTLNKKDIPKGQVGLEIEVEGKNLPKPPNKQGSPKPCAFAKDTLPNWSYVHDGSLRGDDNAEYLLTEPLMFDKIDGALDDLWKLLRKNDAVIDDSNRTSVHVHLNVGDFFLNRLTSFMALYFTMEEVLTEWCGEHRVGNLFCLRAKDAPAIVSQIRRFIRSDMQSQLRESLHYAGLNAHAIVKLGSVEIRTLRGVQDFGVIKQWVAILRRLYEVSEAFDDPRDICSRFSSEGPLAFFYEIMGDSAQVLRQGTGLSDEQIKDSMYEGIRMAQDLCYIRDWTHFREVRMKPDPFGRDAKTIMKKLQGSETAVAAPLDFAPEYDEPEDYDEDTDPYDEEAQTVLLQEIYDTAQIQAQAQVAIPTSPINFASTLYSTLSTQE